MARRRVRLELIANKGARKNTFKKRRRGLKKKAEEISVLCGVEVCSVVFGMEDSQPPDVWPSVAGAEQVLARFRELPEVDQTKRMYTQVDFTRKRINKAAKLLRNIQAENREKELIQAVDWCLLTGAGMDGLSLPDLTRISEIVSRDLERLNKAMEALKPTSGSSTLTPSLPPLAAVAGPGMMRTSFGSNSQWYAMPPPPLPMTSAMAVPRMMPRNLSSSFGLGVDYAGPNNQWNATLPLSSVPAVGMVPRMMPGIHAPSFIMAMEYTQWLATPPLQPLPLQPAAMAVPRMMPGNQPLSFGLGIDFGGPSNQWNGTPLLPMPAAIAVPGMMTGNQVPPFGLGMGYGGHINQWHYTPPVPPMLADMAVPGIIPRNQTPSLGTSTEHGGPSTQGLGNSPADMTHSVPDDDIDWSSPFFSDP